MIKDVAALVAGALFATGVLYAVHVVSPTKEIP